LSFPADVTAPFSPWIFAPPVSINLGMEPDARVWPPRPVKCCRANPEEPASFYFNFAARFFSIVPGLRLRSSFGGVSDFFALRALPFSPLSPPPPILRFLWWPFLGRLGLVWTRPTFSISTSQQLLGAGIRRRRFLNFLPKTSVPRYGLCRPSLNVSFGPAGRRLKYSPGWRFPPVLWEASHIPSCFQDH